MPATFDALGMQFLYPDNWKMLAAGEFESENSATVELPSGGFLSIERTQAGDSPDNAIKQVLAAFEAEYGEVEWEEIAITEESFPAVSRLVDFRFYYLDLLIFSRLIFLSRNQEQFMMQFQAESRDFEQNERVLSAILQQITTAT
jgi:hypothetical protein